MIYEGSESSARDRSPALLARRIRIGLGVILAANLWFALADVALGAQRLGWLSALKLLQIAAVAAGLVLLRRGSGRATCVGIGVATAMIVSAATCISGVVSGDRTTTPVLLVALTLGTAALFPWGTGPQVIVAVAATLSVVANGYLVGGPEGLLGYPLAAALAGFAGSVYVASEFDRHRGATLSIDEKQLEEASITSALQRVGEVLIASLHAPLLLDRLCKVTTEVLGCEFSHTVRLDPDEHLYRVVAGHGDTPAQRAAVFADRASPPQFADVIATLERDGVMELQIPESAHPLAPVAHSHGITLVLFVALRRRNEVFGIQTAGYRGRHAPFTEAEKAIAAGIGRVGSVALESAALLEELESALVVKTYFTATMSHEIKNAMASILGRAEALLGCSAGELNAAQTVSLRRLMERAYECSAIIDATLEMSRAEARGSRDVDPFEVAELLGELERELPVPEGKGNVRIAWQVAAGLTTLHTDRLKLKMVLKNLVANAIKFTDEGEIKIAARRNGDGTELIVSDTGRGIPGDELPAIFQPFHQLPRDGAPKLEGAGLGLYIVGRLVEMLGGTVAVESKPGVGTTFRVRVPDLVHGER